MKVRLIVMFIEYKLTPNHAIKRKVWEIKLLPFGIFRIYWTITKVKIEEFDKRLDKRPNNENI